MKRTILLTAAILCAAGTRAQEAYDLLIPEPETPVALRPVEGGRIYRTEVIPYDKRHDADARNLAGADAYMAYTPEPFAASGDAVAVGQVVEIPYVWTDGVVYLHLENIGTAYTLTVNDSKVAEVEDPSTPAEFALTPYIREGKNAIALTLRRSAADRINAVPASRKAFENCYLYTQTKRSIRDFEIALVPDSTRKFGVLELAIVAQNGFNYDEPVTVGYDIYSPQGKLLEFNMQEVTIPGRSTDTVRFTPFIYGTNANRWEPGAKNPPLYKVMLFTRLPRIHAAEDRLRQDGARRRAPHALRQGAETGQGRVQRRCRPQDDPRGAENAQGQGQQYDMPRLSAAGVVLRPVR